MTPALLPALISSASSVSLALSETIIATSCVAEPGSDLECSPEPIGQ